MMPLNVYKAKTPTFDNEVYKEAIEALQKSAAEADQADARLRDVNCRSFADVKSRFRWISISEICEVLAAMVKTLETATCDDCGVLMREHGEYCAEKEGV